jgi:hypothetical protein
MAKTARIPLKDYTDAFFGNGKSLTQEKREELILKYSPLIKYVAGKLANSVFVGPYWMNSEPLTGSRDLYGKRLQNWKKHTNIWKKFLIDLPKTKKLPKHWESA